MFHLMSTEQSFLQESVSGCVVFIYCFHLFSKLKWLFVIINWQLLMECRIIIIIIIVILWDKLGTWLVWYVVFSNSLLYCFWKNRLINQGSKLTGNNIDNELLNCLFWIWIQALNYRSHKQVIWKIKWYGTVFQKQRMKEGMLGNVGGVRKLINS